MYRDLFWTVGLIWAKWDLRVVIECRRITGGDVLSSRDI